MARQLIVFDTADPSAMQNRCFDPMREYVGYGYYIGVRLAQEAKRRRLDIMTADMYLATQSHLTQVVCLTEMVTPFTNKLLSTGAIPAVCMSFESPLIAKKYYHYIKHYAGRFHHNYQFRGTKERFSGTSTIFHPIVFPMETKEPLPLQPWDKRKYLVLVNSNKRALYRSWRNLKDIARSMVIQIRSLYVYAVDPWMRIREGYKDRIEAIRYFASYSEVELYGVGWNQPIQGFGKGYHYAALKVYKGIIPSGLRSKRQIMSGFKFALCFENCVFPGYVTEKVFDCFLSGCVPIYLGAPDITDFIPKGSFIDYREFGSYGKLDQFLRDMSEATFQRYIHTARQFLASADFNKYTADYFVNDILNVVEQEFAKQ